MVKRHCYDHTVGYWDLIPAALMIWAALSLSLSTKRANSGCVIFIGSPPCLVTQSRRLCPASTRPMSFTSLSTTPAGVRAGAHTPYQMGKLKPATPASAIVGTSGSNDERRRRSRRGHGVCLSEYRAARARWAPSCKWYLQRCCVRLHQRLHQLVRQESAPLLMPAARLNFSSPKCVPVPTPLEPNLS